MADQPTREQFEAAAKKVAATAQPGLSREDFFKLVDKELGVGGYVPPEGGLLAHARRSAAGEGPATGNDSKEPGTWGGGFLKGLRENFVQPIKGEMERAAVPTTGADISNLLLPSEIAMGGVGPLIMRGLRAVKRGAKEAPRYRDIPRFAFSELSDLANLPDETLRSRALNRLPLSKQQDFVLPEAGARPAPQARPSTPIIPPQQELKDLPLWKQQQALEQSGTQAGAASGSSRVGIPPHQPPKPKVSVKPPTNKTQTLDEVLQSAVEDAINTDPADKARRASLAANPDITAGGPLKQSGMFPKSERLGQAGGYTSGRPGVSEDLYDQLMERLGMGKPNPSTETIGAGPHPDMAAESAVVGQEPGVGAAKAPDSNPAVGSSSTGPSPDQPSAASIDPQKLIDESSPWLGDENWSSGAESGSKEALNARALHSYAGEMNQGPKVFQAPGIGELLARILAEGRGK